MQKVVEYREHAKECRELARLMVEPERRQQLLDMAESWERMAEERDRMLRAAKATGFIRP